MSKIFLLTCVFILAVSARALAETESSRELGPIVRVGDSGTENICYGRDNPLAKGSICHMLFPDAEKYCSSRGGLPNAIQLITAINPMGFSEIQRDGYKLISPRGEAPIYYLPKTSQPDSDPQLVDEYWYYSKSAPPYAAFGVYGHGFDGLVYYGFHPADYDFRDAHMRGNLQLFAVRCARE